MYLLPDRILLRQGRNYADLPYSSLQVHAAAQRFIEDGPVASDAVQVGTTWCYVSKRRPRPALKHQPLAPGYALWPAHPDHSPQPALVIDVPRPDVAESLTASLRAMAG
jgi:hypothetical protein